MNSSLLTSRLAEVIFLSPAVEAFGWTLLHFVWQGTLVALAFACFLAFSQGTSPRVRYLVGCTALSLMAFAALSTFFWQVGTRDVQNPRQPVAPRIVMRSHQAAVGTAWVPTIRSVAIASPAARSSWATIPLWNLSRHATAPPGSSRWSFLPGHSLFP